MKRKRDAAEPGSRPGRLPTSAKSPAFLAGGVGALALLSAFAMPAVAPDSSQPLELSASAADDQVRGLADPFHQTTGQAPQDANKDVPPVTAGDPATVSAKRTSAPPKELAEAAKRKAKRSKAAAAGSRGAGRHSLPVPPGSYNLTARFGQRGPWSGGWHTGLDFACPSGTDVHAAASGTVVSAGWAGAYGNRIEISHGDGVVTTYNHLSGISVSTGEHVSTGQKIGDAGSTGHSTGPHVHFEVRIEGSFRDPARWLGL